MCINIYLKCFEFNRINILIHLKIIEKLEKISEHQLIIQFKVVKSFCHICFFVLYKPFDFNNLKFKWQVSKTGVISFFCRVDTRKCFRLCVPCGVHHCSAPLRECKSGYAANREVKSMVLLQKWGVCRGPHFAHPWHNTN